MPLSLWQEILYTLSFDLWKPTTTRDARGVITGETWARSVANLKMQQAPLGSTLGPAPVGRMEADNQFSMDYFACALDTDIDAGDILVNVTSGHPYYQDFFIVRGNAKATADVAGTATGQKIVVCSREETTYATIMTFYGL